MRVKCRFHFTQFCKKFLTEKRRAVFGAKTFAVFAPQQTTVFRGKRHYIIRDLLHQNLLLRIAHIQCWTDVQDTCVDVTEHTVA